MFALIAALIFSTAFLFSVGLIVLMLASYHDKMVAALLYQPIPKDARTSRMTEVRHVARS